MIIRSTWAKTSSSSPEETSIPTSSTGRASRPLSRSSFRSRSRSGMRAASTWTSSMRPLCPAGCRGKLARVQAMAVATREYGLFIGGESTEAASGEARDLAEPATGEPLASVATAGEADVDRAVEAARGALAGPRGKTPPNERSRLLHALADALVANRKELAELEARNVGSAISSIAGRSTPIGGSLLFYSLKEPVGVAGQIVPWNYPLMMTTWKLAPALAAGCSVVLKPDSATPLSALRMAELAGEVGFPPGAINVVPGPGTTVGAHLVRHPDVDKIAFTGSTATGPQIMRLASG